MRRLSVDRYMLCRTSGRPSSRMVLLKGVSEQGFVFFTNFGMVAIHSLPFIGMIGALLSTHLCE
jgi:hypothetical protein